MIQPYGPANARLMIVTDQVSYRDIQSNTILQDREFDKMFEAAGGIRFSCFTTALMKGQFRGQVAEHLIHPLKRNAPAHYVGLHDKLVDPLLLRGLESLRMDIELVKPRIILGLGAATLFALCGKSGIKSWRSSLLRYVTESGHECYVIPTYHPSYVQAVWKERNTIIHDLRKAVALAQMEEPPAPPAYDFIIQPSFTQAATCLTNLLSMVEARPTKLSVDVETRAGHLACTGIAWSNHEAICIPQLKQSFDIDQTSYWMEEEEAYLTHQLYRLLTHPNAEVIGQNFLYDAQYFYRWLHFIPNFARDTMIAQHSIFSNMPKGLDYLSSLYCGHHVYWKDESKNWDPRLGERQLWNYNCLDCVRTFEIDTEQQRTIDHYTANDWPELRAVHDFQQSLFFPVLQSMIDGLRTDNSTKATLSAELSTAIKIKESWLESVIGHPINIKSPLQMKDFFYRELAQKEVINRKTGNPTCDDTALEKLGNREPLLLPVTKTISELRSLGVFRSTFLEAPIDTDQRMRCSFNIAGTDTYRFSSSENAFGSGMNLQNIPSGDEAAGLPNVRKLFITDPDQTFFDIDLDSADLRIVTWESDCAAMKTWFAEGKKPYIEVAKEYYQDDSIDKHHPAYPMFKALCHATNYLGTASGVSGRIGLEAGKVASIQDWYFSKFPEIKDWQERVKSQVRSVGYVQNVFGYRIYIFDRIEGTLDNEIIAWIPQSTVACLINRGYAAIHRSEPDIKVLLQVHDSLAGQFPTSLREQSLERITRHCSIELPYKDPLTIPVGVKTSTESWGGCQ